jgi:hypothetical protein
MTADLDSGDEYRYRCILDALGGKIVAQARVRTIPESFAELLWLRAHTPRHRDQRPLPVG